MNAKLGWDTAVAASERLSAEVAQLRAENARLKAEIEALKPKTYGEVLRENPGSSGDFS